MAKQPKASEAPLDRTVRPARVYAAMLVCVAITWLLSSGHLVAIAGRGAFGPQRDAFLAVTRAVHDLAVAARLDRPEAWMAAALGRSHGSSPAGDGSGERDGAGRPTPAVAAVIGTTAPTASPTAKGRATATPVPRRKIAPDMPLRVFVAGDSFAQPLGQELAALGVKSGMAAVELNFRISSGLARPDYFDWTAPLAEVAQRPEPPDAVVIFMGANDDQNMITAGDRVVSLTTTDWRVEYQRRAAAAMDVFRDRRVGVVFWVGLPIMRDPFESQVARDINTALEAEAERRSWMRFVDIWSTFSDANGHFAAYLPDANDRMVQIRQVDGVHLQREGTRQVAALVYADLGRQWNLAPPTATATTTPTATSTVTPIPSAIPTSIPTLASTSTSPSAPTPISSATPASSSTPKGP